MRGFKMTLSIFVLAMVLASGSAFANMNKMGDRDYDQRNNINSTSNDPAVGDRDFDQRTYMDKTSNDPAVSVPNVEITPNGDRAGVYPPYSNPGK